MVQGVRARIGAIIAVHLGTQAETERREKRRYKREMTHYYLGYVSLALYIASFLCYARFFYVPDLWLGRMATFLLAGGIVMHYFALLERSRWIHTVPYNDLYGSMSLFAWLLGITYLGLELFHRQRSVGAFVTLLLIVWIVLLARARAQRGAASAACARPAFCFSRHARTPGRTRRSRFSFVLSLIYLGSGPRAALSQARHAVLALSGARRARSDGAKQRLRGLGSVDNGRDDGARLAAPVERRVLVGRSEGGDYACDSGGLRGISAVVAKRGLARRAGGEALRV